ncbi:MAG TPA: response regulator transcription factor [Blastocatellia bacterium]|nr:response regulator transcription factor [Blastocatellia bacterium]
MANPKVKTAETVSTAPAPATNGKLLVIEDDSSIQQMITDYFRHNGYEVATASDGEAGIRAAFDERPDALILDVMLPKTDGFSVCRHIRERNPSLPILILTAKDDVIDKVLGLEMGADDYITKPFSLRELEARVKSVLRRMRAKTTEGEENDLAPIVRGSLRIDPARREVTINGRHVELTPKEFELLALFASHPGRVYSRKYLLENIWDYTYSGYDRTIDSHINRLRSKIEEDPDHPKMVLTVWGVGYKFSDENGE